MSTRQIQVLLSETFWKFFFLNIFHLWLVESSDVVLEYMEGQQYFGEAIKLFYRRKRKVWEVWTQDSG